jgi:hypothetical protein
MLFKKYDKNSFSKKLNFHKKKNFSKFVLLKIKFSINPIRSCLFNLSLIFINCFYTHDSIFVYKNYIVLSKSKVILLLKKRVKNIF